MTTKAPVGWENLKPRVSNFESPAFKKAFAAVDKPPRKKLSKAKTKWHSSFKKHYKNLAIEHPYADKLDVFMLAGGFADADSWKHSTKKTFKKTFK